ncbi:peptidase domain-containing ABC transporter [Mucilaginibacter lappiensis]|uniref:ATP-binding cassette subfamily B protein n=1 Tax=Mucilaginibacter lappiensis TaxID=354630 RepID=A0A1N7FSR0_9SPHI|nr:peptidase domain-containing ABC transporter [Mucilaginibacter lappiensis]MBB6112582.1 ATP-binding cassette subfamily B protein [Mucilaginibacter lappiensis]MBB6129181.1 ATP-binding cassette subfamily B protein [Mucilaginibacter lappiensis]SIS03388.1 bacteriocin-processing peptidase. Cysteine peptidase. MEROPS family C39 [Mucilaginibacter lappiensis]
MSIKIKQRDITDCGAACLASVSSHYKLDLAVARIRQLAGTDKKGTNVLGMVEAAQKLGFEAKGVKGPFESLFKIPKPAIAHLVVKEILHHYVVIYKVTDKFIEVMDPIDGQLSRRTHDEFKKEWSGTLVLLLPSEEFEVGNEKKSVESRFWTLIKPHKSILIQALFGAVVYTILGLSTSVFVQKLVDFVLVDGNHNLLNIMGIGMVIILALQLFIGTAKTIFTLKTGQMIDAKLILGYYKHLLRLPQQFFDTMRVGEIISRINDAVKIRTFLNDVSINFLVNIFIVVFSFIMMFSYYWKLALIMLSVIPLYLAIYYITDKLNKKAQRKLMEDAAELESQLVESLNSVGTIKRFGLESHADEKTEVRFVKLLKIGLKSNLNSVFSGTSSELISRLLTIALLWVGAGYVMDNKITPGELLSFYTLIGYFTGPVSSLIGMNRTVQDAVIAADRLFEIMDLERESDENQIELSPDKIGDIRFENVSFRYGTRVSVFDNLNLIIPKGKFTAIVGESGSGKSTLMSILQNIYPIQGGNVRIGDYDLKYIKNSSLRQMISVVPQQIDLFAGNVIDNIAVGDNEPDMKKIIDISAKLGITGFIESLPKGFQTYLGENGTSLSGGQRQRIAIARALYRSPEILILDEATSSLDSVSEKYVQKMIEMLKEEEKTVIVITHRSSTLNNADNIIVLDKGVVVEQGSHKKLNYSLS